MLQLYIPDEEKTEIQNQYNNIEIKNNLTLEQFPDATFVIDDEHSAYGVVDKNNNYIPASGFYRYNKTPNIPKAPHTCKNYVDDDVIYCCGGSFFHFGHFLTEGMARIWPHNMQKYKNMKYVFHAEKNKIPSWARALLNLAGIRDEQILLINKTTRFRNLYVPQQSHVISNYASHQFAETFASIASNITPAKFDKIYVSRTAMGDKRTFGEEKIQNIFAANGFKVICPEKLPVAEQIALMRGCKVLAGCAGTALHLAAFMPTGGTVIQLKRCLYSGNEIEQQIINKSIGLNFVLISASIEKSPSPHYTDCPQIIGGTKYLKQFFDEHNFNYTQSDLDTDADTWNEYETRLARYHKLKTSKIRRCKQAIARIVSIPLPRRRWRSWVRNNMERLLGYQHVE